MQRKFFVGVAGSGRAWDVGVAGGLIPDAGERQPYLRQLRDTRYAYKLGISWWTFAPVTLTHCLA